MEQQPTLTLSALMADGTRTVPYHPQMPLWQYLRSVIVPAYPTRIHIDGDGNSVTSCLIQYNYVSPSQEFRYKVCFDYENRLKLLGDVIPPYATLGITVLHFDKHDLLRGNAAAPDTRPNCAICAQGSTNMKLAQCAHAFHKSCFVRLSQPRKCPLCLRPLGVYDREQVEEFERDFC